MTKKHRPSDEKLGQMLNTPHFGSGNGGGDLPPADPITPTQMVLTLEQIRLYEHNPRRERNPLYDEIKESIRAQGGLNNPLTVTRRPNEEHYIVESGGNTRLAILNELFQETKDDVFFRLHVLYRPWQSETHVLSAHLIENEKRGDMLFIDKALAVQELKTMFEAKDGKSYSFRQLKQRLSETGYAIDLSLLSRMNYAVTVLLPLIPEALRAGMGRPQTERIRQIENAFQIYWTDYAGQDKADFSDLFQDCLTEHNRPEWDNEALISTLEERFADLLDIPVRSMRLDIDALLHGRKIAHSLPDTHPSQPVSATDSDITATIGNPSQEQNITPNPDKTSPTTAPKNDTPIQPDTAKLTQADQDSTTPITSSFSDHDEGEEEERVDTATAPINIEQARNNIYDMAHRLATHYKLEQCIQPSPNYGLGFLVDLPDTPLIPDDARTHDANMQWTVILQQWVWWMLYVCSEETVLPERIPNLPESMTMRDRCLNNDQQTLMQLLGQPTWISIAYQFFADPLFPDHDFESLMTLIRYCRQLRSQIGADNEVMLWPQRSDYASA